MSAGGTGASCAVVAAAPFPAQGLDALTAALAPKRPDWVVLPALEADPSDRAALHPQLEAMAAHLDAVVVVGLRAGSLPPDAARRLTRTPAASLGTAVYLPSGLLGLHVSTVTAAAPPADEPPPVVHLPGGARVGILAPGELRDPALCAYLAKRGAQVILAPRAAAERGGMACRSEPELARTRARDAGVPVVVVGVRQAAIALPDGSLAGASGPGGDGRAIAALSLSAAPPAPAASAALELRHREHPERPRPWALVEHTPPTGPPHLDLFLARGGFVRAFRLERLPTAGDPAPATRAFDHRARYLDHEGPLSGGRGAVRRVGGGTHRVLEETATRWTLELSGTGPLRRGSITLRPEKRGPQKRGLSPLFWLVDWRAL